MCKSGGRAARAARALHLAAAVALLVLAPRATATTADSIELSRPVQESLARLEQGWLRWTSTFYTSDEERSEEAVDALLAEAGELGFSRLPDLAAGARGLAVEAAREGAFERAERGLAAAERLAPGEPENAFATARVAALAGRQGERVAAELRGWLRIAAPGLERRIALASLAAWLLAAAILAGSGLVALLALVHGRRLLADLRRLLPEGWPTGLAAVALAAILVWPLLLPGGPLWLVLYLSVLLWGYGGRSERVTLALVWLVVGAAPLAVEGLREHVERGLAPPARAIGATSEASLYGGLFADLALLPELLPGSPAVAHFLGDVHRELGQWEIAREHYEQVIAAEPSNADALIGLGAYHFNRSDFGRATELFQRAAAADPRNAAAHFDLSKAYVESYLFDESREALAAARALDDERVSEWMRRPERDRIVVGRGGLDRSHELLRALEERGEERGLLVDHAAALAAALIALALAAAFTGARERLGGARRPHEAAEGAAGPADGAAGGERWRRALVPGLASIAAGHGGRAWAALALAAALLLVPVIDHFAYAVPWRLQPSGLLGAAAIALLVLWLGARLVLARREGRSA